MNNMTIRRSGSPRNLSALFVGPFPPPYGGIATHIAGLTTYLGDGGSPSRVLTFTAGEERQETIQERVHGSRERVRPGFWMVAELPRVIRVAPWLLRLFASYPRPRRFVSMFLRSLRVVRAMRRNGVNTVSIYGTDEGDIIPLVRLLHPRARILYTIFAAPYMRPGHYQRFRSFYRKMLTEADCVLASSDYCAGAARQLAEEVGVDVVYYGVDTERFQPGVEPALRSRNPALADKLLILLLARMEPEMGFSVGLEIARQVNGARDDTVFVFAGARGSLTQEMEEEARASEGRIRCVVDVPAAELPAYYASADIILAPTADRWACMGLSIKEALASGRPVVASQIGGIPEAVRDGVEGFLVPADESGTFDASRFAAAISTLCGDAGLREAMGRRARARAEEVFSIERTHERVHRLLVGAD